MPLSRFLARRIVTHQTSEAMHIQGNHGPCDFDHRRSEVGVTALPHNFGMQDEAELIFHNADRHTEFHRATCLAFRVPPRVRLKDGEYLFVLWDRLALEKTPVDMVDLPHRVR